MFALALVSMVPFVILAEKYRKMKPVFLAFIALVAAADLGFVWLGGNFWAVFGLLYVFFTGFNLLEATLPSMISKIAPPDLKGTAMGVYSTAQFLGAFAGGRAPGGSTVATASPRCSCTAPPPPCCGWALLWG